MPMFILESVEVMDTYKRISGRPYRTETLKQLLSMEIAYNNTLRRIWHLPTYEDYLKQLLSMEIAYNNILRRSKDLTSPYAMPYEDLHLTAGLHSLVNRTISLKSTLRKRSCCTDSLAIICVIPGLSLDNQQIWTEMKARLKSIPAPPIYLYVSTWLTMIDSTPEEVRHAT